MASAPSAAAIASAAEPRGEAVGVGLVAGAVADDERRERRRARPARQPREVADLLGRDVVAGQQARERAAAALALALGRRALLR